MPKTSVHSSAPPVTDRRKSLRADLVIQVDYQTVDELFSEFTTDINEGGLFVETESPQPVGTVVALHFKLPGDEEPVRVSGRVVRASGGPVGQAEGMGIEFDALDSEARQRIDQLVRRLRPEINRSSA